MYEEWQQISKAWMFLKTIRFFSALVLLWLPSAVAQQAAVTTNLEFESSDATLTASFRWATSQALQYAHSGQGTIGPWVEAALPGRNAFCMRDVSHQTAGIAALGLYEANKNMLGRFAQSVAPSRDWAGYWEVDGRNGEPSSADYVSDTDFWFNLPGEFDLLDAIARMWRWTGDSTYQQAPEFHQFFVSTTSDYLDRWDLGPDQILRRPRIANRRLTTGKFVDSRGIPSYTEGPKDFIFGADLLAAEYRGLRSFQDLAKASKDEQLAVKLDKTATQIQRLLETVAWSKEQHHYFGVFQRSLRGYGSADALVLYFDAVKDPNHLEGALNFVASPDYWQKINIEEETYAPLPLFRYGRSTSAYRILLDLSSPTKARREYPEVSYSVIAAIVSGAMGINPGSLSDPFDVETFPQPINNKEMASVRSLRIRKNNIDVTEIGANSTRLTNASGPSLHWRAVFTGSKENLIVNGRSVKANHSLRPGGLQVSYAIVPVPVWGSVEVHE